MRKKMIFSLFVFAVVAETSLALAGDVTPKAVNPIAPPGQSTINEVPDKSLANPMARQPEGMLDMTDKQAQQMRRDAAHFVGNRLYISNSCLTGGQDVSVERLDDALTTTMIIPGKWSHVVHGVSVESGIVLGQAMCSAFIVRDAQNRVMVSGSVSVGVLGINDNNGRSVVKTIPNRVRVFYKSRTDLKQALAQIEAYARYYISFFNDPKDPTNDPPSIYIETMYDIHRCGAGKLGKRIDVSTCPKETRTLPVK